MRKFQQINSIILLKHQYAKQNWLHDWYPNLNLNSSVLFEGILKCNLKFSIIYLNGLLLFSGTGEIFLNSLGGKAGGGTSSDVGVVGSLAVST